MSDRPSRGFDKAFCFDLVLFQGHFNQPSSHAFVYLKLSTQLDLHRRHLFHYKLYKSINLTKLINYYIN